MFASNLFRGNPADWLSPRYSPDGRCIPHWLQPDPNEVVASVGAGPRPLIVIDVGHGYYRNPNGRPVYDGGAKGQLNGRTVYEHGVAQQVAKRLKPLLEAEGFDVQLTQTGDRTPLANRFQARLDVGRDNPAKSMHLVLHANASESPSAHGFAAMYHHAVRGGRQSHSARWAHELEREFPSLSRYDAAHHNTSLIQPDTYTSPNHASWSITRGLGDMPAVLAEMGYMTNARDLAELASDEGQQRIAARLARATVRHYDTMHREGAVQIARGGSLQEITRGMIATLTGSDLTPQPLVPNLTMELSRRLSLPPPF
ncbi:MAG: hypothetical protein DI582_04595 [Azospirillum brasilense]|nr:MAG: hypothetical protein DI582_04595 [Azospirillum brasilense]